MKSRNHQWNLFEGFDLKCTKKQMYFLKMLKLAFDKIDIGTF